MTLLSQDVDQFLDTLDNDKLLGWNEPFDSFAFAAQTKATLIEAKYLQPYLAWRPLQVI